MPGNRGGLPGGRRLWRRLLGPGLAVLFALALSEAGLRVWTALFPRAKSLYQPGSRFVALPDSTLMPGVSGPAVFTVNELGLRGPSVRILDGRRNVYRIVAVGGSSTQCVFLDDSEAWPQLLMKSLNARQRRHFVFVGNTGAAGHTFADHLKVVDEMTALREANLLVFLIGINDLSSTLRANGASTGQERESRAAALFEHPLMAEFSDHSVPLHTRLRLYRLIVTAWRRASDSPPVRETAGWHPRGAPAARGGPASAASRPCDRS